MSDLTVRRFEPGDGERVRELNELAMAETPEYVPDAPDDDLRDVPGHYLVDGEEFLVCEGERRETSEGERGGPDRPANKRDGTVVATGAYVPLDDWKVDHLDGSPDGAAELTRMRVAPDHQGRGVGTAVYRDLERRAAADGYDRFVLDTGVANERARGFYESLGFEHVGTVDVTFEDLALELAIYRTNLGE